MRTPVAQKVADIPCAPLLARIDPNPARRGKPSRADEIAIGAGFLLVLDDQVGKFADRAGAETEQHGGVVLGEALEVAVHPALARGGGKRLVGPRAVVDADGTIAGAGQAPVDTPGPPQAEHLIGEGPPPAR